MSVLITINLPQLCTSYVHTVRPFNVVLFDSIVYMFRVSFRKMGKGGGGKIVLMKEMGGGKGSVHDSAPARGVLGHAPPENFEFYTL